MDFFYDDDSEISQKLLRCRETHESLGRCQMHKNHLLPHMVEIENNVFRIWPEFEIDTTNLHIYF